MPPTEKEGGGLFRIDRSAARGVIPRWGIFRIPASVQVPSAIFANPVGSGLLDAIEVRRRPGASRYFLASGPYAVLDSNTSAHPSVPDIPANACRLHDVAETTVGASLGTRSSVRLPRLLCHLERGVRPWNELYPL